MRLLPGFVVATALLTACSGDDGGPAGDAAAPDEVTTTTTAAATATACPPGEAPIAATDLDGDGTEERWRAAGSGAAADIVELVVVDGCDEVPVRQFAVGGSVRELQGVRCDGASVVLLVATSDDGETYATVDTSYELRGTELVETGRTAGRVAGGGPELAAYSSFDC